MKDSYDLSAEAREEEFPSSSSQESEEDSSENDIQPEESEEASAGDTSTGDVTQGDADTSTGDVSQGDTPAEDVTPGNPGSVYVTTDLSEYDGSLLELIAETEQQQLQSLQRIELQHEALISILLIIIVVGLLQYIYKFFRLFI